MTPVTDRGAYFNDLASIHIQGLTPFIYMNSDRTGILKSKIQVLLNTILSDWHFMRWLRLGLGLYLVWQLVQRPDIFTGIVAAFFLFQAVTNTGCCGASGCAAPQKNPDSAKVEEVKYEEVK